MGKTKRGKGTKMMAVSDGCGLPIALYTAASASPHEVTLVAATLAESLTSRWPDRLIGDGAYESDALDADLARLGVEMIAPHRRNRRRWKIQRLFAWIQNFRRLVVRYECRSDNFLGMTLLACALILLRHL